MFRTLIYPSSGACDCVDELPHRSSCSQFFVCWSFCCGWYFAVFVLQAAKRTPQNISRNKSSNTQRTENKTTDVVIHQHSRRLLKMDILMSEKCWAHNKWNKTESDIKLVFHSSTIAMMHGPINIRVYYGFIPWNSTGLATEETLGDTHHWVFSVVNMNDRVFHWRPASSRLNPTPCVSPLLWATVLHKHSETVTQSTAPFGARWRPMIDASR